MPSSLQTWALPASLLAIVNFTATWYQLVSSKVPEPYLVCMSNYGKHEFSNNTTRMSFSTFRRHKSTVEGTIPGIQKSPHLLACMMAHDLDIYYPYGLHDQVPGDQIT